MDKNAIFLELRDSKLGNSHEFAIRTWDLFMQYRFSLINFLFSQSICEKSHRIGHISLEVLTIVLIVLYSYILFSAIENKLIKKTLILLIRRLFESRDSVHLRANHPLECTIYLFAIDFQLTIQMEFNQLRQKLGMLFYRW